jgi:hypothetical protein
VFRERVTLERPPPWAPHANRIYSRPGRGAAAEDQTSIRSKMLSKADDYHHNPCRPSCGNEPSKHVQSLRLAKVISRHPATRRMARGGYTEISVCENRVTFVNTERSGIYGRASVQSRSAPTAPRTVAPPMTCCSTRNWCHGQRSGLTRFHGRLARQSSARTASISRRCRYSRSRGKPQSAGSTSLSGSSRSDSAHQMARDRRSRGSMRTGPTILQARVPIRSTASCSRRRSSSPSTCSPRTRVSPDTAASL